jgi:hypothetical protein
MRKTFMTFIFASIVIISVSSCTKKTMYPAIDLSPQKTPGWTAVGSEAVSAGDSWYSTVYVYNGTPYVCFKDFTAAGKISAMKYEGGSWQYIGGQGFSTGPVSYPAISVYNGEPYVMFADINANSSLAVRRYTGGTWQNVGPEYLTNTATYMPSFFISQAGVPYVAYSNAGDGSYSVNVMSFNGSAWAAVGSQNFSLSSAEYTSIYVDGTTPYVAYKDYAAAQKCSVMKFDGAAWVFVGAQGLSTGAVYNNSYTPVFVSAGVPYVAYADNTLGKVQVMKYNSIATTWEKLGADGINASPGLGMFLSLYVYNNTPYVSFWDNVAGGKVMVTKFTGTAFEVVGNPGFSYGSAACTSIFVDSAGVPYVSYVDAGLLSRVVVKKYY